MFEFTIKEIIEQIEDDLFCIQKNAINTQEYLNYFIKIFPKDRDYSFLLDSFINNMQKEGSNLYIELKNLLENIKNKNKKDS